MRNMRFAAPEPELAKFARSSEVSFLALSDNGIGREIIVVGVFVRRGDNEATLDKMTGSTGSAWAAAYAD